jgi:hypothetical protein
VTGEHFEALLLRGVVVRRDIATWIGKDLCVQDVSLQGERKPLTADGIADELWHGASFHRLLVV